MCGYSGRIKSLNGVLEKNIKMNSTCHSEVGKIKSVFIKNVQQAFISDEHIEQYWEQLKLFGKTRYSHSTGRVQKF
jgi:hypothetical protein